MKAPSVRALPGHLPKRRSPPAALVCAFSMPSYRHEIPVWRRSRPGRAGARAPQCRSRNILVGCAWLSSTAPGSSLLLGPCHSSRRSRYIDTILGFSAPVRGPALIRRLSFQSPLVLAPAIFMGLLVMLWSIKSLALVVLQNYIIYMPYLPPGARRDKISNYHVECAGVKWDEFMIRSSDGTAISLCVARETALEGMETRHPPVYILYCQGNGSSLPPRLKYLSSVLRQVRKGTHLAADVTIAAVSYRGYWKSKGRPSEQGINHDVRAALQWVSELHEQKVRFAQSRPDHHHHPPTVIFWGQSIGCGFTTNLAAAAVEEDGVDACWIVPDALVLETPFLSMRDMLAAVYPAKWIPYRYLGPFLCNFLDSYSNLGLIARKCKAMLPGRSLPGVYIIDAGRDELVPRQHAEILAQRCSELGIPMRRTCIETAYHNEVGVSEVGREAIAAAICDAITQAEARTHA